MFDRRAKIFLAILVLFTFVLLVRAVQLQVVQHGEWDELARRVNTRPELIETTRGQILDFKGRPIATSMPCVDACVDYRAITDPPDEQWVHDLAVERVKRRTDIVYGRLTQEKKRELVADESELVLADISTMWRTLGMVGNLSADEITDLRHTIDRKVYIQRRHVWYASYERDMKKFENRAPGPWYRQWFLDDTQQAPELDKYDIKVGEQFQPHVIIPHISNEVNNFLGKNQDQLPGLVLKASIKRYYPYKEVAAHVIGQLAHVSAKDVNDDKNGGNDLREYKPNDLIGRSGLEALAEPLLRGTRGRNLTEGGQIIESDPPVAGIDIHTTIDMELQQDIELAFKRVSLIIRARNINDTVAMPGAAVVIDVPTGEVRALVSYPSYDLNTFDEDYQVLAADYFNRPLMNRATQFAMEPGSTVKPMVGLSAITQGVFPADGTVECTGFLVINGVKYSFGRCWTESGYHLTHKDIPLGGQHPTGFLTYPDALERSCNVFFETVADRLGMKNLHDWFSRFGLGRPTGIGIDEVSGTLPDESSIPASLRKSATWFAGIGQGQVHATPIQMANVAATIARNGIMMRPHLVPAGTEVAKPRVEVPDRVDLQLSSEALAKAKEGMIKVVNDSPAGTGLQVKREGMIVAGKTGTAQAAKLTVPLLDENRHVLYVKTPKEVNGKIIMVDSTVPQRVKALVGTHDNPNPEAPWYRGGGDKEETITHAWFIGFAPADKPKIAFAVFVEYGFGGGDSAGSVARQLLDACVAHGYLQNQ